MILVRLETNPDDVHGMIAAEGILTSRGGRTSHAAVVARGMGKPCVAGAETVQVDLVKRQFTAGGTKIKEGEPITIDGATGEVIQGQVAMFDAEISGELEELLRWADALRRLEVWANGDYPQDAERAREFGAQGIGLCRTEHMFMQQERLPIVQEMILAADDEGARSASWPGCCRCSASDFRGHPRAMRGLPVVIRLIDPPLHEFLPSLEELLVEVDRAAGAGRSPRSRTARREQLLARSSAARAEPDARAARLPPGHALPGDHRDAGARHHRGGGELKKEGVDARPEIMVPLVGHVERAARTRERARASRAGGRTASRASRCTYKIGTMIEVPTRGADRRPDRASTPSSSRSAPTT